jgi:predicted amidohydrolase YtcJ
MEADAAALQICTQAIGDEGISVVLDLLTKWKKRTANCMGATLLGTSPEPINW